MIRPHMLLKLFSESKFFNQNTVSLDVDLLEIFQKSSSLTNHLKESSS